MKRSFINLILFGGFLWSGSWLAAQDSRIYHLEPTVPPCAPTNLLLAANTPAAASRKWEELDDLGPEIQLARRPQPPRPTVFELSADTQYSFDSNILLMPRGQLSDGELSETLALAASPRLLPGWTTTAYLNQQFVRYNKNEIFDFDGQTAGLSLSHAVGHWCNWYGGFSASRLCAPGDGAEFFKEFDTVFGAWRSHALGRAVTVYYGYQFDWMPTHPMALTRIYNAGYGGINWQATSQLLVQLLYRLRAQDYLQSVRSDFDHSVNLTMTYTVNRYVAARIYAAYCDSTSNQSKFDYQSFTGGGGLTLTLKF